MGGNKHLFNFTHRPLYPRGMSPLYPLDRRLSGPQSRSGRWTEENISCPCRGLNPNSSAVQPIAHRYTDWAILPLNSLDTLRSIQCRSTYNLVSVMLRVYPHYCRLRPSALMLTCDIFCKCCLGLYPIHWVYFAVNVRQIGDMAH
jgi:hypothetical protein